jgi:hypothetical protein
MRRAFRVHEIADCDRTLAITASQNGGDFMKWLCRIAPVVLAALAGVALGVGLSHQAPADPPKRATAPPKRADFAGPWKMTMLTVSGNRPNRIFGEHGAIPVRFKATHKTNIAGPYRFVVSAVDRASGGIAAEKQFGIYQMDAGEIRDDQFECVLEVPAGVYNVVVELRDLRRVVDLHGNQLAEYLGQGNEIFLATVQ